MNYAPTIWLAYAPPGVWSPGPAVIREWPGGGHAETLRQFRQIGWHVSPPYRLDTEAAVGVES